MGGKEGREGGREGGDIRCLNAIRWKLIIRGDHSNFVDAELFAEGFHNTYPLWW